MRVLEPTIRCLARTADVCGEGGVWHAAHQAVYWTDINRGLLHRLFLVTSDLQTWQFEQPVTALALTTDSEKLLVVLGGQVILWDLQRNQRQQVLFTLSGWPSVRCNDADVDPAGTLWIGTMQNNVALDGSTIPVTKDAGELLSLQRDGSVKTWQSGVKISNTVAWSPDGETMYFGDTLRNEIYAYSYERQSQAISRRRIFASGFHRGLPDGSAVDTEGYLWNCRYGGGCLVRFAPGGEIDRVIEMPVANPTTCAFGGEDLQTLFVTSAGEGRPTTDSEDGGLFCFRAPVAGLPANAFRL
jgi:sugar lactone lactonase YvrE